MTPSQLETARRLHLPWGERPGVRLLWSDNFEEDPQPGQPPKRVEKDGEAPALGRWLPDLSDTATGGVLLVELWKVAPLAIPMPAPGGVAIFEFGTRLGFGATLAEACALALLAKHAATQPAREALPDEDLTSTARRIKHRLDVAIDHMPMVNTPEEGVALSAIVRNLSQALAAHSSREDAVLDSDCG